MKYISRIKRISDAILYNGKNKEECIKWSKKHTVEYGHIQTFSEAPFDDLIIPCCDYNEEVSEGSYIVFDEEDGGFYYLVDSDDFEDMYEPDIS